jgi:hypothetical protein
VLISRNSFQPLVMRKSNALADALAAAGGIPADFAGGDPNWICTGSAEVDGVLQALIENRNTSEGVFLKQGDHWKNCVVSQVEEDNVTLVGPGGVAKVIHVKQDDSTNPADDAAGTTPFQPQLNGPIGGGAQTSGGQVTEAPALPAPTTTQADDNNAG